jgi:hypothetical protein
MHDMDVRAMTRHTIRAMRRILLVSAVLLLREVAMASELPKTVAELSNYASTSRYEDVVSFVGAIRRIDPDVRVETFAHSNGGRALPLVIVGPPGVVDPRSAKASGLPIVFIMANIHAGEVEGKEAALMLLRDLVSTHAKLRQGLVILIAPIYNADGNEKISSEHRTTQHGPINGVGVRENEQGLDLNRDYMKLETPEARGLVANVLDRWDPLLTVDLHTTNGSYHGYQLTYSPMLNPNADDDLVDFERGTLLPAIREQMKKRHGKETYYYGNFVDQLSPEKGWHTFDSRPRFGNNYVGLRNRFVILSEAYSYIDFRARVEVTYEFVHSILEQVDRYGSKMMKLAARADEQIRRGKFRKSGVRFEIQPWKSGVEILWERCVAADPGNGAPDPETGKGAIKRTGEIVPVRMTDYGIFASSERSEVPYAYVLDPAPKEVIANLRTHGIVVEQLAAETTLRVSQFQISETTSAEQEFQKHHELTLKGKWKDRDVTLAAGTHLVRMNQPLARLAFYLLEPRSDDGLFDWNFFEVEAKGVAPVWKVMKEAAIDAVVAR